MYMIKTKVVSTDGLEPPITEPKPVVLPIALCAESKLPALTSKESIKCFKNKKNKSTMKVM